MVDYQEVQKNGLLSALPEAELQRWLPQLEQTDLPLGRVLYSAWRVASLPLEGTARSGLAITLSGRVVTTS